MCMTGMENHFPSVKCQDTFDCHNGVKLGSVYAVST